MTAAARVMPCKASRVPVAKNTVKSDCVIVPNVGKASAKSVGSEKTKNIQHTDRECNPETSALSVKPVMEDDEACVWCAAIKAFVETSHVATAPAHSAMLPDDATVLGGPRACLYCTVNKCCLALPAFFLFLTDSLWPQMRRLSRQR